MMLVQFLGQVAVAAAPTGLPDPPKVPHSPSFWMPNSASNFASPTDGIFIALMWISAICMLGVAVAIVGFCQRYRATSREANEAAQSQVDHSNTLEITWSIVPLFVCIGLFVVGFKQFVDLRTPPRAAYEVHATGQRWKWGFEYPEGLTHPELHVPVGKDVRILIQSVDVIHSLYIPEFRVKMDAVPGRYTELWFKATQEGTFPVYCAEYCGTSHSDMLTRVVVHSPEGFQAWVADEIRKIEAMPLAELGELTFNQSGCSTCHSLDGSAKVGPSFKGVFGRQEKIVGGATLTVDENYLRESILEPQAKLVEGFPPAMPTFKGQLSDRRILGLVEFIKGPASTGEPVSKAAVPGSPVPGSPVPGSPAPGGPAPGSPAPGGPAPENKDGKPATPPADPKGGHP
ncbi:MAG: cytochrome c oxidase subunit II [Deltaproteobacteria bacterium]